MTDLPDPTPNGAARATPTPHHLRAQLNDAFLVGGQVPVAVWRLADRDDTEPIPPPGSRLLSRLAQRLILVYTRHGDAVVDLDSDPNLADACVRTNRTYLPITEPGTIPDLDTNTKPVSLVVLRWPPRHTARTPASLTDLFAACRLIMTAETCAIASIASPAPNEAEPISSSALHELLPAARAAGLTHVLQIVAITAPDDRDEFLYYATRADADEARHAVPADHPAPSDRVDLLFFTLESSDGSP
jgi:hypothetical protein